MNQSILEKAKALYDSKRSVHKLHKALNDVNLSEFNRKMIETIIDNANISISEFQKEYTIEVENALKS